MDDYNTISLYMQVLFLLILKKYF